ncbi:MAG: outer membrane beta-barrel protein [Bacteroidota bacterium]
MKTIATILMSLALFLSVEGMAQSRWAFELRGAIAFPTQELGNADLSTGFGFEPTFSYRFMPHLGAYAGWGWHRFTTDEMMAQGDTDVEETGYTFGLQFIHPIKGTSLSYFVRGGGIYNHIELENDEGDITADSGHGLGWQAEVGIVTSLNDYWSLMPGVRYRALAREIDVENVSTDVNLNYLSVGVSFSRTLGSR